MSGLCGWLDSSQPASDDRDRATADRLSLDLPTQEPRSVKPFSGGIVLGAGNDASTAIHTEVGMAAALAGRPRWTDSRLAALAQETSAANALLSAYREYGDSFPRCLSGAFALAIVDFGRARTVLAVDRMGICPLCYATTADDTLVFGTTATSVAAHPAVSNAVSAESLYRYFYFHVVPSPSTIFAGISKLEPAQMLIAEDAAVRKEFYWQPQPVAQNLRRPENELLEQLREQTRDAVLRTEPDDQTACFLSGGLDSSTVSGIANEATTRPIRAYTIGFDEHGFDETSFARAAAKHFGLDHIEYYITPTDVADAFDLLSTAYDEPFGNSSAIPAYFCARKAREDGVSRLLAGDGGDELFGGNERYATQKLFEHYQRLPRVIRSFLLEPTIGRLRVERPALLRKAWRYIEQAKIRMPDRLQTYNFLEMFPPTDAFEPGFLDSVDLETPIREMRSWYERHCEFDFLDRMLLFDWKLTLADNDIRKVNRMCETAGVAVDYPLLDERLVEFSLQLPSDMKLRGHELRYAFKQAHRDYLPREVLEKDKHGFGLPFGEWLKSSDELRGTIMPAIEAFRERGILRDDFVDEMLERHRQEHAGYFGNMLWLIAVLEKWLAAKADRR